RLEVDFSAAMADVVGHLFIYAPGPVQRIGELIGQRSVVSIPQPKRSLDRSPKRELPDPLGGEVGVEFGAWKAPQLFAIGFEKHVKQLPPEAAHDPSFEVLILPVFGAYPRTVGDCPLLRSLRSKRGLSPSPPAVLG